MIIMLTLIQLILVFAAAYEMRTDDEHSHGVHLPLLGIAVQIMIYSVTATSGLSWGGCKAEAKTWWLLKSSPISPTLLFNSKFFIGTLCAVTYANAWFFLGLILFRISPWLWLPILLMSTVITATATAFNTAMGTLPWVAEIGETGADSGRRPVLRLATLLVTMITNLILLSGPTIVLNIIVLSEMQLFGGKPNLSLSTLQQLTIVVTLSVLIGVWAISYLLGRRSLRKLLYK